MNANKRKKLEAAGWAVGTTSDFLALSDEEATIVEMRVVLASALRARRLNQKFSQAEFAKRIRSSQSRVGKMEKADSSVSLELLVKSLVSLGATRSEIGNLISASDAEETKAKKDRALSKV